MTKTELRGLMLVFLLVSRTVLGNCAADCAPVENPKDLPAAIAKCRVCKQMIGLSEAMTTSPVGYPAAAGASGCMDVGTCIAAMCPRTLDCVARCQLSLNACNEMEVQAQAGDDTLVSEVLRLVLESQTTEPEPAAPPSSPPRPAPAPAPPAPPAKAPPAVTASFCPGPQNPNPPYNCL